MSKEVPSTAPSEAGTKSLQLPNSVPFWRLVTEPGVITQDVLDHPYPGAGTEDDPYSVNWLPNDFRNPLQLKTSIK